MTVAKHAAAKDFSVAEIAAKARLRIINCPFRISSTLQRNRVLRPAANLCWSFGLSSFQSSAGLLWAMTSKIMFVGTAPLIRTVLVRRSRWGLIIFDKNIPAQANRRFCLRQSL